MCSLLILTRLLLTLGFGHPGDGAKQAALIFAQDAQAISEESYLRHLPIPEWPCDKPQTDQQHHKAQGPLHKWANEPLPILSLTLQAEVYDTKRWFRSDEQAHGSFLLDEDKTRPQETHAPVCGILLP